MLVCSAAVQEYCRSGVLPFISTSYAGETPFRSDWHRLDDHSVNDAVQGSEVPNGNWHQVQNHESPTDLRLDVKRRVKPNGLPFVGYTFCTELACGPAVRSALSLCLDHNAAV